MKKILLILISILIISGCTHKSSVSVSVEKSLPKKIEKIIEDHPIEKENAIQLFYNEKNTYYIVYDTNKQIDEVPLFGDANISGASINILEGEEQDKNSRYIFKLKTDKKYPTINLRINGTPSSFDAVTQY